MSEIRLPWFLTRNGWRARREEIRFRRGEIGRLGTFGPGHSPEFGQSTRQDRQILESIRTHKQK